MTFLNRELTTHNTRRSKEAHDQISFNFVENVDTFIMT